MIMSSSGIRTNENDVLLGRGGNNHSHCGNEQLRRIAHGRVGEYIVARKKQKAVISRHQEGQGYHGGCVGDHFWERGGGK